MFMYKLFILSLGFFQFVHSSPAFVSPNNTVSKAKLNKKLSLEMSGAKQDSCPHPFSELPGDPSLVMVTNLDLGDKKLEIMKGCSKAISTALGKPESYVAVSITDNASVIFGGSDDPCALGSLYSIGAIGMEPNGKIQAAVTDLLEPYGLKEDRIYINFFDVPRANVGWSRRTFAG
eukprot:CAMPEP_0178842368 /NCGR_PEP_ID=MMETSP0746-20121128/15463_1 /TAXON_ID=913974 /ORGANISM="Nitzschia punctata, Strain CCMP561" /LENGTH=175 /DNA_ID=CAMNT_0020505685 /DNA_START=21 /DNA_END=548 /DNA_ORIENTATION=+